MGTTAGPRIDDRLRRFIEGSPEHAAEVTRRVGALAWQLGLPRPSYQQVRVLLNASRRTSPRRGDARRAPRRVVEPARRAQGPAMLRAGRIQPERSEPARRPAMSRTGRAVDLLLRAGGFVAPRTGRAVEVPPRARRPAMPRTRHELLELIDRLWEYPAPGLSGFYERYKHGRL